MPILAACPACRQACTVADQLLGKRIRCPHCRLPFVAEAPDIPVAIEEGVQAEPPPFHSESRPIERSRSLIPPPRDPNPSQPKRPTGFVLREFQMGLIYVLIVSLMVLCTGIIWLVVHFLMAKLDERSPPAPKPAEVGKR